MARDPGFRDVIFKADYDNAAPNGDCRYMLPKGMHAVPDVSCDVSFKSDIIKTEAEFHQALSTSAHVEGGGLGFQFSASASYQKSSSDMSSQEFVYVISKAQCTSYFSRMKFSNPPKFDSDFVSAISTLKNGRLKDEDVNNFIETYGTHFVDEMTFGSTYTQQHKIKQANFKTLSSGKFSVDVQASYSGLIFSGGGGFSLDKEQRKAATDFSKMVETTTTTVGSAPPSNGDAMTWASVVKENPVPIRYSLKPISELFTPRFMASLPGLDASVYNKIHDKLRNAPKILCDYLVSQGKSLTCDGQRNWKNSQAVTIRGGYPFKLHLNKQYVDIGTHRTCDLMCSIDENCIGFVHLFPTVCYLINDGASNYVYGWNDWTRAPVFKLFWNRMKKDLIIKGKVPKITASNGDDLFAYKVRFAKRTTDPIAVKDCRGICVKDRFCQAFLIRFGDCSRGECAKCYILHKIDNLRAETNTERRTEFHFVAK